EMEERRAREEEEQRKAEEKQLAREEEQRRAKEEEERLARENEERERKFREEEDKRARESEERSRKAKEEAILAAKTRGDMASGDSAPQDRRAKGLKRGPGVAAAYRRPERNWGKPVTVALGRVLAKQLKLEGPLPLPPLDVDVALDATGLPRVVSLAGPENLVANLSSKGAELEFEMSATSFALPIAPALSLDQFGMKGTLTRRGMNISSWDGAALNGSVSGTAKVRWGGTWNVEGAVTARGINAAVFAPALLLEGRGEGTGRFWMTGAEPAKLASGGRLEGNFTVNKGVLGSFDLSRAIQTG